MGVVSLLLANSPPVVRLDVRSVFRQSVGSQFAATTHVSYAWANIFDGPLDRTVIGTMPTSDIARAMRAVPHLRSCVPSAQASRPSCAAQWQPPTALPDDAAQAPLGGYPSTYAQSMTALMHDPTTRCIFGTQPKKTHPVVTFTWTTVCVGSNGNVLFRQMYVPPQSQ